jgi:exopolyphosphatase/guanosine-5'-triphosphate,3'-diphosphate pyrophosphatase
MKVHKVQAYKAFATSAMREAYNGKEVRAYQGESGHQHRNY